MEIHKKMPTNVLFAYNRREAREEKDEIEEVGHGTSTCEEGTSNVNRS